MVNGTQSQPGVDTVPIVGKVLLTALTLLREFSATRVPCPFAEMHDRGAQNVIVGMQGGRVVLYETDGMYVMHDKSTNEPYEGTSFSGMIGASCPNGWKAADPAELQRTIDDRQNAAGTA